MKRIPLFLFSFPIAVLLFASLGSSHASSIVKATYKLDGEDIALMVCTGSDGGPNSDHNQYWSLLGKTPEAAYSVKIKPDESGGKTATLKGKISVSVEIRNKFNMGTATTDHLSLVRNDPESTHWYLPADELKRLTALIDKETGKGDPSKGQKNTEPPASPGNIIVPLDVKGFTFFDFKRANDPIVCKSPEQLNQSLGEEISKRIQAKVDLSTHEVVVFRWDNSGSDSFEVQKPKKSDDPWLFLLTKGFTKAKIQDIRAYAVPKNTHWTFRQQRKDGFL